MVIDVKWSNGHGIIKVIKDGLIWYLKALPNTALTTASCEDLHMILKLQGDGRLPL